MQLVRRVIDSYGSNHLDAALQAKLTRRIPKMVPLDLNVTIFDNSTSHKQNSVFSDFFT